MLPAGTADLPISTFLALACSISEGDTSTAGSTGALCGICIDYWLIVIKKTVRASRKAYLR